MSKKVKRLFSEFNPKYYIIDINIDKINMKFNGSVIVTGIKTSRPSQRLTFHQKNLTITSASITKHNKNIDTEIPVDRINNHNNFDEVRLHSTEMLYPGNYTIRLNFKGKITRNMNGIYPCFFKDNNKEKTLIATQFESHHAREVFPCIDEPEAKSIFQLSLTTPKNEVVLSNTPIVSQIKSTDNTKQIKTTFEPTPHMSTYLLAFIVGELEHIQAKTKHGVTVRSFATKENIKYTKFALDIAVKSLEFYNEYFGIDYPLEKCDIIALPDFASGAMENWGCITFREHAMLVDPKNTTLSTKQYVALVMAHELAHQWFGNLVTMKWWNDLWLNEGFASWIEYLAVDHIFPEWNMWTQFTIDEQQQALKLDSLENTHPIDVEIHHPDEIRTIFDAISYSKGASIINMLHDYLGAKDFKNGLRHYLETYKYKNTDTTDLWSSLEFVSGKSVKNFMHDWTTKPGFPLLEATISDKSLNLKQSRFYTNPLATHKQSTSWPIPLLNSKILPDTMHEHNMEISLKDTNNLKINQGQSGFYRVTYNTTHLKQLGENILKGHLNPTDRLGILTDLFETSKAGKMDTADALHFLTNYKNEDDYTVWDTISNAIGSLRLVMNDEELREDMKPYIINLITPQLNRLGWDRNNDDNHFDLLLRPIIFGLAASADEPTVVKKCISLFKSINETSKISPDLKSDTITKNIKRTIDIDPDMRGIVFNTVARLGGSSEYDKLLKLHNDSTYSEERTTIAAALTGFKQPKIIDKSLELISSDQVRLQDVAYWITYSFMNRHARMQTWEWLKKNWDWLETHLGSDLSFYRMPIYSARVFSDNMYKKEYIAFFKPKLSPALDRSYKQGLEMIEWQTAWKERSLKEVKTFFKNQ